jgi:hypothetical protein
MQPQQTATAPAGSFPPTIQPRPLENSPATSFRLTVSAQTPAAIASPCRKTAARGVRLAPAAPPVGTHGIFSRIRFHSFRPGIPSFHQHQPNIDAKSQCVIIPYFPNCFRQFSTKPLTILGVNSNIWDPKFEFVFVFV